MALPGISSDNGSILHIQHFGKEAVSFYWPSIEKALDDLPRAWVGYTKQDIFNRLLDQSFQMWGLSADENIHVLLFSRIDMYPTGRKVLRIIWALGSEIEQYLPHAANWCDSIQRILECDDVVIETPRYGWAKLLKQAGFEQEAVVLRRAMQKETIQ